MEFSPSRTSVHHERTYRIRLLGTGAADPTVELGQRVTVARQATGVYRITWAQGPGTFIGFACGLGAATPGDVKGQTVTRDTYDTTNLQLDIALWSSTFAADDLQATEYMDLHIVFAETVNP